MTFIRKKRINGNDYYYLVKKERVDGKVKDAVHVYLGTADDILTKVKDSSSNGNVRLSMMNLGLLASIVKAYQELQLSEVFGLLGKESCNKSESGIIYCSLLLRIMEAKQAKLLPFENEFEHEDIRRIMRAHCSINDKTLISIIKELNSADLDPLLDRLYLTLSNLFYSRRFNIGLFPVDVLDGRSWLHPKSKTRGEVHEKCNDQILMLMSEDAIPLLYHVNGDDLDNERTMESITASSKNTFDRVGPHNTRRGFRILHCANECVAPWKDNDGYIDVIQPTQDSFQSLMFTGMDGSFNNYLDTSGFNLKYVSKEQHVSGLGQTIVMMERPMDSSDELGTFRSLLEKLVWELEELNEKAKRTRIKRAAVERRVNGIINSYPSLFKSVINYSVEDVGRSAVVRYWINRRSEQMLISGLRYRVLVSKKAQANPTDMIHAYIDQLSIGSDCIFINQKVVHLIRTLGLDPHKFRNISWFLTFVLLGIFRYLIRTIGTNNMSMFQLLNHLESINISYQISSKLQTKSLFIDEMTPTQSMIFSNLRLESYLRTK